MKLLAAVKEILAELATLQRPVTAAAVVAVLLEVLQPLGISLSGAAVAGVLAGIGAVAALAEKLLADA